MRKREQDLQTGSEKVQAFFLGHPNEWFRGLEIKQQTNIEPQVLYPVLDRLTSPAGNFLIIEEVEEPGPGFGVYYMHLIETDYVPDDPQFDFVSQESSTGCVVNRN